MSGDDGAKTFIKRLCQILPYEKLYTISARKLDKECKDLADLNVKCLLNEQNILETAVKIDRYYFDEVNNNNDTFSEHVKLAEQVLDNLYVKFYNSNFYVYENGVYRENLAAIEHLIQELDRNSTKSMQSEILNYIRIKQNINATEIDENLINFKNGIYNIKTHQLEPHNPSIFTVCQLNANYVSDEEFKKILSEGSGKFVDKFLQEIGCGNIDRINALLEYTGYSMTYSVRLKKCLFLLGSTADNGKSTFLELLTKLFRIENVSNISIAEFSERFCGAQLENKLLNIYHEIENISLKNKSKFKIIVAGNSLKVEEKYKKPYNMKPFAHHIFAMNNLPEVSGENDEGYFTRLHIIKFEAKFTEEQKEAFDFDTLTTTNSLDYLANLALRKYEKMLSEKRQKFSNYIENDEVLDMYKSVENSVLLFLEMEPVFFHSLDKKGKVKRTELYKCYQNWCMSNNLQPFSRLNFYAVVLDSKKFITIPKQSGIDYFQYNGSSYYSSKSQTANISKRTTLVTPPFPPTILGGLK